MNANPSSWFRNMGPCTHSADICQRRATRVSMTAAQSNARNSAEPNTNELTTLGTDSSAPLSWNRGTAKMPSPQGSKTAPGGGADSGARHRTIRVASTWKSDGGERARHSRGIEAENGNTPGVEQHGNSLRAFISCGRPALQETLGCDHQAKHASSAAQKRAPCLMLSRWARSHLAEAFPRSQARRQQRNPSQCTPGRTRRHLTYR